MPNLDPHADDKKQLAEIRQRVTSGLTRHFRSLGMRGSARRGFRIDLDDESIGVVELSIRRNLASCYIEVGVLVSVVHREVLDLYRGVDGDGARTTREYELHGILGLSASGFLFTPSDSEEEWRERLRTVIRETSIVRVKLWKVLCPTVAIAAERIRAGCFGTVQPLSPLYSFYGLAAGEVDQVRRSIERGIRHYIQAVPTLRENSESSAEERIRSMAMIARYKARISRLFEVAGYEPEIDWPI